MPTALEMRTTLRSIAPFARVACNGFNLPLSSALQSRAGPAVLNLYRGYAEVYQRTKPHVNIGALLDLLSEDWYIH